MRRGGQVRERTIDEVVRTIEVDAARFAEEVSGQFQEDSCTRRTRLALEYAWFFLHVADWLLFQKLGDPGRITVTNELRTKTLDRFLPQGITADQEAQ
jgi:hypothetical protein